MSRYKSSSEPSRLLFGPENSAIWLVAIIGLSLSFAALLLIRHQLAAHNMLDFEWVAHNRIRALNHGLDNSLLAVTTLRDHVIASGGSVEEEGFRVFAESLLDRYRGVQALMWVPLVDGSEIDRFEAPGEQRKEGVVITEHNGHFEPIPATKRAEYFPVRHVVPELDGNIPEGFDLGSIPKLAETLSRASDQGRMAASDRIAYPSPWGGVEYGFMVANPLFGENAGERRTDPDRSDLTGFVVGFFRIGNLANAAISLLEPRGVEILILDESAPPDERFLHFYASRLSPKTIDDVSYELWQSDLEKSKVAERVQVADRQLAIVCGRTHLFRSAEAFQDGPWLVLVAGLLFTVLLSFYLARIRENIQQRSAMERQLLEREELFRQMTETVDEAFWATDANGGELLYISPAYAEVLGIADEVRHSSLLDAAHPEDRQSLGKALQRTGREGTDTEVVYRIRRADGMLRWVRARGFAVRDKDARIYRVVGFVEDITERKLADEALRESEAKLRDLFQQSPDVIMTVDVRGKILLMNRSTPALPADRAVGHNSLALMPRGFRKWFRKALKKVFRKSKTQQFQYSADDGTYWG